ncbi:MAG: nucleotidyltransferase domain-containing protein [Thiotrichaceae bacterium]|nr:nucleotidyltransferase domain-containing protein [Thiotrichaceae bacterium]
MNIISAIQSKLDQIEIDHSVKILYACESGSRAWGFESQDSDYDVRFIYANQRDWYLSVNAESQRDVIELPVDEVFDINGWDLRKSLKLMKKSNPALMEWLSSSIIYRQDNEFTHAMKDLMKQHYSPKACFYHYFHMAKKNNRQYLKSEQVQIKKYFYVLRPLLAMQWLEKDLGIVPLEFDVMVNKLIPEGQLKEDIAALIERKKVGFESKTSSSIKSINQFIRDEIERLSNDTDNLYAPSTNYENMNLLFRKFII